MESEAAALAVVGLRQVDELEVKSESAGEQDGALDGQRVDQIQGAHGVECGFFVEAAGLGIAAADGALAQGLDLGKKLLAGLFAQHIAEQRAEGTHVAAEGSFLQVAGLSFEFGQPLWPAFGIPKQCHRDLIMHEFPG